MAGSLHSPSAVHPCGGIRAERAVVVQYATLRTSRCAYTARGQSHLKFNVCESELNELREEGAITARRCCNQDSFAGFSGQGWPGVTQGAFSEGRRSPTLRTPPTLNVRKREGRVSPEELDRRE